MSPKENTTWTGLSSSLYGPLFNHSVDCCSPSPSALCPSPALPPTTLPLPSLPPAPSCSLDTDSDGFLTFEEACMSGLPGCGEWCPVQPGRNACVALVCETRPGRRPAAPTALPSRSGSLAALRHTTALLCSAPSLHSLRLLTHSARPTPFSLLLSCSRCAGCGRQLHPGRPAHPVPVSGRQCGWPAVTS